MSLLHIFDMDGTLLCGSTASLELSRSLGCLDELLQLEGEFAERHIDTRGFAQRIHALWRDLTEEDVEAAFSSSPWLTGISQVCTDIRSRGEHSAVVTMSPDFFARRLIDRGVDEVVASSFPVLPFEEELDPSGILDPTDKVRIVDEIRAKYGLSRADCVAYGDSMSDAPLFRTLETTIAVNADDHLLDLASVRYQGSSLLEAYHRVRSLMAIADTNGSQ